MLISDLERLTELFNEELVTVIGGIQSEKKSLENQTLWQPGDGPRPREHYVPPADNSPILDNEINARKE